MVRFPYNSNFKIIPDFQCFTAVSLLKVLVYSRTHEVLPRPNTVLKCLNNIQPFCSNVTSICSKRSVPSNHRHIPPSPKYGPEILAVKHHCDLPLNTETWLQKTAVYSGAGKWAAILFYTLHTFRHATIGPSGMLAPPPRKNLFVLNVETYTVIVSPLF